MTKTNITTRDGSVAVSLAYDDPWLTVRMSDGEIREWYISDFRSDGGLIEILRIVEKLPKKLKKEQLT